MALNVLPIIVPTNYGADGPILDVSILKGEKTILLDGSFDGTYVLYGSHDNVNFVPVFSFFGARPQSIKQIFESSYLSVRLRSLASNAVGVGVSISGEFSTSANSFAPLPIVATGAYGPQAIVDLFALVPPSGFLSGTNIILTGNFIGVVSVEGSLDGIRFSPVAVFRNLSAPSPNNGLQTAVAQNNPAAYTQQVRYLRVNVLGGTFVLGTLFVTVGGETEDIATSSTFLSEPVLNGTGTLLLAGEVVRISADETVSRARADVVGNVKGLVGVMLTDALIGTIEDVVNSGKGFVLLETGLTVVAGDQLWVSPTMDGRATNLIPLLQAPLGIVKDASPYAATGGVIADVNPGFTIATAVPTTLHQSYGVGIVSLDQTLSLLDANGGGFIVDGTAVGFTGAYAFTVKGNQQITLSVAVGVATPTARVHAAAGTAAAGTASLKIPSGVVLAAPEAGAVEADANHLYWTNSGGTRLQLDNTAVTTTLAQAYANGTLAADQTLVLLDAKGGEFIIDGTEVGFTGTYATQIKSASSGFVNFPRVGGMSIVSLISVAAAPGSVWDEVALSTSTLTLTGGPAISTMVAQIHVGQGTINGAGNTVTDSYDFLVDAAPTGSATLTRSWSAGFVGAVQAQAGLVLGTGLAAPSENDLVFGAGATVVSAANSCRFGYIAGATQQPMVSINTGTYVPLLYGPTASGFTLGSIPFGSATGTLSQDNTNFFWDNTNKRLGIGVTPTATLHIVQPTVNAAVPVALLLASGAHTAITSGTQDTSVNIDLSATKTWATGAIPVQREVVLQAPTYAFAASSTITTGATVAITGPPIAGLNATITTPLTLWTQSGSIQLDGGSYATTSGTKTQFGVSATFAPTSGGASFNNCSMAYTVNQTVSASGNVTGLQISATETSVLGTHWPIRVLGGISGNSPIFILKNDSSLVLNTPITSLSFVPSGTDFLISSGAAMILQPGGSTTVMLTGTTHNVLFGLSADVASSKVRIQTDKSVVAATGSVWNGIDFNSSTLTLTGTTSPITSLTFFNIAPPTITAGSNVVTTDFFTCRIGTAVFTGAGPASTTRNWALGINGNTKYGGGQTIHCTDVNVAGPYVILATDFYLQVRRTTTAAISLNLPSIAIVGDGFMIQAKDSGYNATVNPITWVRNGADTVENAAANYIQNVVGSLVKFVSNTTTNNWELA